MCRPCLTLHPEPLTGLYTGSGNSNIGFGNADLQLDSLAGPENTVLDCGGSRRAFSLSAAQTPATLIAGLTITNCR
jgi:hypothetical protein